MNIKLHPFFIFLRRALSNEFIFAPLILVLIARCVFHGQFSGVSFATFLDNTYMYLPVFSYASRVFASGEYPYWINSLGGGIPLFDSPQLTVDYPLYLLRSNLYDSAFAASRVVHYLSLLHYTLLLITTYILLRTLKIGVVASLAGAVIFGFSANFMSYIFALTLIAPYCWLPLFVASLVLLMEREDKRLGFFLCIFSIVMLILAAPSLPMIHTIFISAVICIVLTVSCYIKKEYQKIKKFLGFVAAAAILSFLILSPYLVSELISMPGFIRWIGEFPAVVGNAKIPFGAFLLGQLSYENLWDVLFPPTRWFVIGNPFFGIVTTLIALLSLNRVRESPVILGWLFLALWGLGSAFGSNFGFAYVNYHIPFFNLMREPGRHLLIFIVGASVLFAYGLDYIIVNRDKPRSFFITKYNGIIAFLVCSIFLAGAAFFGRREDTLFIKLSLSALALLILYVAVAERKLRLGVLALFVPLVVANNLIAKPFIRIPMSDGDYFSEWNLRSHEILDELSRIEGIKDYRIVFDEPAQDQFWSMNASYHGIRTFNVYFNPLPAEQFSQLYYQGHRYENYRELLGTKYFLCKPCNPHALKNYRLEREIYDYKLYKTDKALPRYKIVHKIKQAYVNHQQFYEILGRGFDFTKSVLVRARDFRKLNSHLRPKVTDEEGVCTVREEKATINNLTLSATCNRPGILILNEFYTPHWIAHSDGKRVATYKVNLNQVGIPINQGKNFLEIQYQPSYFYNLRMISKVVIVLVLVCLLVALIGHFRAQRSKRV